MTRDRNQEPTLGARMLEIVVGTVLIGAILWLLIASPIQDLIVAQETGLARFTRSGNTPQSYAEKPFLFMSIIASKFLMIALGIGAIVGTVSVFFLRNPPVRW